MGGAEAGWGGAGADGETASAAPLEDKLPFKPHHSKSSLRSSLGFHTWIQGVRLSLSDAVGSNTHPNVPVCFTTSKPNC